MMVKSIISIHVILLLQKKRRVLILMDFFCSFCAFLKSSLTVTKLEVLPVQYSMLWKTKELTKPSFTVKLFFVGSKTWEICMTLTVCLCTKHDNEHLASWIEAENLHFRAYIIPNFEFPANFHLCSLVFISPRKWREI